MPVKVPDIIPAIRAATACGLSLSAQVVLICGKGGIMRRSKPLESQSEPVMIDEAGDKH